MLDLFFLFFFFKCRDVNEEPKGTRELLEPCKQEDSWSLAFLFKTILNISQQQSLKYSNF